MGLLDKLGAIGQYMPGAEVAKGLAYGYGLGDVQKQQDAATQRKIDQDTQLIKLLRDAKSRGDTARVNKIKGLLKSSSTPGIISEALKDAPTSKQIAASGAELALLAATGFKPGLKATSFTKASKAAIQANKAVKAASQAKKLAGASKIVKFGSKVIKPVAREAAIGSLFGAASKVATDKDATINDIIKSAELGAVIGGGTTAAFIGAGAGLNKLSQKVGPKIRTAGGNLISNIERTAAGQKPIVTKGSQVEKTLSLIGEPPSSLKRKTAQKAIGIIDFVRSAKSKLIDKYSPFQRIENKLIDVKGRPLKESEKIYRDTRILDAVSDAGAERKITGLVKDLKQFDDIQDELVAYTSQLDFIDRAKLGNKVPGDQKLDDLIIGLKNMTEEIGPDDMKRLGDARKIMQDFNVNLLQERVDAGLITKEAMDNLLSTHPNYIPHNVIMDLDEASVKGIANSLNVSKTDIMKAVGSVRNIDDPIVSTIQRTPIATRTIEKNKILNNFVNIAEETPDLIPGMRQLGATEKVPSSMGSIDLYRNGVKNKWIVPKDVEIMVKNMDGQVTPDLLKPLAFVNSLLKKGATQLNLSFSAPNLFRDKQTAALTAGGFIDDLAKKYGTTGAKMNLSSKEIKDLYKASGGFGASIFKDGDDVVLNKLRKTGIAKKVEYANPIKMIETINEQIEQSSRLSVFKKALNSGLSPKDAALASRDATIDFAKMGSWMKPLNQAIPFLNARVQGFANLPKAFFSSPEAFARAQLYTSVYPTMLLHEHNRRFESYANVNQYIKNKYWVIMTGEVDGNDSYTGNPIKIPQFVTIPKGEGQALVSSPIQWFLEKQDGLDFRKGSEVLADTVGAASPLSFQSFGQGNKWLSGISQLGPAASIPVGLATNVQPFSGQPVIPPDSLEASKELQFRKDTPEVTKNAAGILNIAPARLQFILDTAGAGLSQDVQDALDIAYNVVRGQKIGNSSLSETPFGQASELPISRRFVRESGEYGSPLYEKQSEQKQAIEQPIIDEALILKRRAEEIVEKLNKTPDRDARLNYLNSLGEELDEELRKKVSDLQKRRSTVEVLSKSDRVEVRAKYINDRIDEMIADGTPKEERIKFLNDLDKSGIKTDAVSKAMAALRRL